MNVRGSKGYDVDADALVRRYENVRPLDKYRAALYLIPATPSRVLDVGAGSGVDAAWFASLGHEVLAVEPTAQLRRRAIELHGSLVVRWMDDSLPHLRSIVALDERFELIVIAGVWTHLDEMERSQSFKTFASLLAPGGIVLLSIRHGAAPAGRLTFPLAVEATIASAARHGLAATLHAEVHSQQVANRIAGVTWTWLAFGRA